MAERRCPEPGPRWTSRTLLRLRKAPQHVTEKVLRDVAEERGITIHRPHKVVDLKPNATDPNFTDVSFENGHVVRARAVVGADGSRSTVSCHVAFSDPLLNLSL